MHARHACVHVFAYMDAGIWMCLCVRLNVWLHDCVCWPVCMPVVVVVSMYVYVCGSACVCAYEYVCVCRCMYD